MTIFSSRNGRKAGTRNPGGRNPGGENAEIPPGSTEGLREHLRLHGSPTLHLSGAARGRILESAQRQRVADGSRRGISLHGFPGLSLTAAAVAFLILSAGFMAGMPGQPVIPGLFAPAGPTDQMDGSAALSEAEGQGSDLWVDYREGQVIVSWKASGSGPHAIREGSRVSEARSARPHIVEGNSFVRAGAPAPNQAVFYVVE
jgi:hypothetical protein